MATTINAGRVRFVSRGTYNNSTQYYLFDLVDYNGSSYIAKENTAGNLPTNNQYWQLIAEKGNTGSTGQTGPVGPTGNGIASIRKTGTSGLVDTYTITYTNGNTTTFTVTNGEDANTTDISKIKEEITALQTENSRLKGITNALPKISGEDTSLTLTNTANAPLSDIILKGNTSQKTTTGKNLIKLYKATNPLVIKGLTVTRLDDNTLKINGTSEEQCWIEFIYAFKNGTEKQKTPLFKLNLDKKYVCIGKNISGTKDKDISIIFQIFKDNSVGAAGDPNMSISIANADGIYRGWINIPASTNFNNYTLQFQLEEGTTPTDFEPYTNGASPNPDYPQDIKVVTGDNTITISNSDNTEKQELPISLGSLELCKIGDYQDYIYKNNGKWYKHKETNHILLDGVNVYFVSMSGTTNSGHYRFVLSNVENKFALLGENVDTKAKIFSNKLLSGTREDTYRITNENVFAPPIKNDLGAYGNIGVVYISAISQMTLDNANAWLKDNNIDLYYVLATPTEEEITDTTLISQLNELEKAVSYDDTTNISQTNANLPFIINAEAFILYEKLESKQDKLIAGTGIEITGGNTINNIQGNYSTDEIRIGTWMGKPLYRKVTPVTTSTTFNYNTWVGLNTINVNSVSQIIECKYFANLGYTMPLIAYRSDSGVLNVMNLRNTTIESSNFKILLEYTKTTD